MTEPTRRPERRDDQQPAGRHQPLPLLRRLLRPARRVRRTSLADPHHEDPPMRAHLAGCGACAEEAETLRELLGHDAD